MTGTIVKSTAGYYYVSCESTIYTCRGRGKLRLDGESPLVGDNVEIQLEADQTGSVTKILPRRNYFIRPAVANIDILVMIASAVNPITEPILIDRVSTLAEYYHCEFALVLNKSDIKQADSLCEIYRKTNYPIFFTSATTGEGIDELNQFLSGKICAFTGNSGVGKSSILNAIQPDLQLQTGEVSDKLGRGKHTTRHVELFPMNNGGFIADTPGFGSFDVNQMQIIPYDELDLCFPEFLPYKNMCRFDDCHHDKEPNCAIREAVEAQQISSSRYASYIRLLTTAKEQKMREYK